MKSKQKSGNMLECSHCDKVFKYNSEKTRHEISHYQNFVCEICNKKFGFISALRRHQKQHERTGSVKCKECDRSFRDEVLLKRHVKYAHKGSFSCSKCSSKFSSDLALRTHMKTHKPAAERRFKCSHEGCDKSFNFSHHLKHHELTHSNVKQHFSGVCGKGFIQSHHLKAHIKTHNPTERLYCEFLGCKKKFSTEYAKKRHMRTHKTKPDSGISSDSNSCDASIKSNDTLEDLFSNEKFQPINFTDIDESSFKELNLKVDATELNTVRSNYNMKTEAICTNNEDKDNIVSEIGDCETAVGTCISNENCICDQITNLSYVKNDSIDQKNKNKDTITNIDQNFNKTTVIVKNDAYFNNNVRNNICAGCECANICTEEDRRNCNPNNVPNIENRGGVIKLKNTFDLDFKTDLDSFVPFSTCQDIIGKCIVEGDGCLCARMIVDEQQAMAQEIADLTPQPKTAK